MSRILPRCERLLLETELETKTGKEKWICNYTAVGVDSKMKHFPKKCFITLKLLRIKLPKPTLIVCSLTL